MRHKQADNPFVNKPTVLRCPRCGNEDLFAEFMAYEVHLVNGKLNYLHLLAAETDYYRCYVCDQRIEAEAVGELRELE